MLHSVGVCNWDQPDFFKSLTKDESNFEKTAVRLGCHTRQHQQISLQKKAMRPTFY